MSVVSPLSNKSLNLLKTLKSAFRLCDVDKRSVVTVQSQEHHTKKDYVKCLIERSELIKLNFGEYVQRRIKSSSCIDRIKLYPSGKNELYRSYVSLDIQFKDLQENMFIEGNVYILGKDGSILWSKVISGCTNNLKEISFDTFLLRVALNECFVNNALNIQVNVINVSQTYKCVSDNSDYRIHHSPKIVNFQKLMLNFEKYADVILEMDSKMINCHKCIISSESQPFLILFRTCKSNIIGMHDKSATVLEDLIRFIYCGNILSLNFNHICQLYIAADEFGVLNLKDICSLILCSSLSKINVPYIFELSVAYRDQFLIEACINFVKKNDLKILKEAFVKRSLKIKN